MKIRYNLYLLIIYLINFSIDLCYPNEPIQGLTKDNVKNLLKSLNISAENLETLLKSNSVNNNSSSLDKNGN